MHETKRNSARTGTSPSSCHRIVERRSWNLRSGEDCWCSCRLRSEVARCLQTRWHEGLGKQATTGSTAKAFPSRTSTVTPSVEKRPGCSQLSHQLVDTGASHRGNPQKLFRPVSPLTGLTNLKGHGLELPETRTTSSRTRRESHRKVAQERLATYKKKPKKPVVALFSLMKAALCSSLWSVVPGGRGDKHRSCIAGPDMTDFRPSRRLLFRLSGIAWVSILTCGVIIFGQMILKPSFVDCFLICLMALYLSWIVGRFTDLGPEDSGGVCPDESKLSGCRLMHRSLILRSRFGTEASILTWPTLSLKILLALGAKFADRYVICAPNSRYYSHFSKGLNSNYELFL